jgi:hypothetical protein
MTQENQDNRAEKAGKAGVFWMLFPVLLLVTSVSGWLLMVSVAVDDPGFAVEPDYYKRAAHYDEEIEQRAENARLGYEVELVSFSPSEDRTATLVVAVHGAEGEPLPTAQVGAEVIPVARAFEAEHLALTARGPGVFEARLLRPRPGLYEVRVRIEFQGRVFTRVLRPELVAISAPSSGARGGSPPV